MVQLRIVYVGKLGVTWTILSAMVCVAALTLAVAPAKADLIVNGSFEDPTVPVGSYTNFPAPSSAITGWTVVGVDSAVVSETFTQSGIVFQAEDGHQWLDLSGVTSNSTTSGVSQNVATVIGQPYLLSFYVGSATDNFFFYPATVDLSIDGGARVGYTNLTAPFDQLDWELFSVQFTATQTTTNLTFFNGGAPNNYLAGLDHVSLEAGGGPVPEPATLLLLGLGLAGLAGLAWGKRRSH